MLKMRPQKYKNYLHTIVKLFIFMTFFFRAARLPAVAVGLSALLASLVLAPIPAAFRRNALSVTSDKRNKVKRSLR